MLRQFSRLCLGVLGCALAVLWATNSTTSAAPAAQGSIRPRAVGDGSLLGIQKDTGPGDGLFRFDPEGGGRVRIAPLPQVFGLTAFDSVTRRMFLLRSNGPIPGGAGLLVFNVDSGTTLVDTPLAGVPGTLDYDPVTNSLLAESSVPGPTTTIARVHTTTGAFTPLATGLPDIFGGSAFDPVGRRLYLISSGATPRQLVTVDVDAGTFTVGPTLTFVPGWMAFEPATGSLLVADGRTSLTVLYRIDPISGALTTITSFASNIYFGGTYDPVRRRSFLVQSLPPSGTPRFRVINTTTGATVYTWDLVNVPAGLQYDATTDLIVPTATPTLTFTPSLTPTQTATPSVTQTPTVPPGSTETPTVPPGSTHTPTVPPGSTSTPTVPPGSTNTPTVPPGSTRTPTATVPPGSTQTPTLTQTPNGTPGAAGTPTVTPVAASGKADSADDSGKPVSRTAEQRHQQQRTDRSNTDTVRTEGNVLAVDCASSQPTVTIANRDGEVTVTLIGAAVDACSAVRVGDYLQVEGEKQHEHLFEAEEITVTR